jgi:hypothetical protein
MKFLPWQLLVTAGLLLIIVKLLIDLLVPIGIVLVIVGVVVYFQERNQAPKVVKK